MRPLTAATPKPLLLTAGKPFLEHTLDALKEAGIEEVYILLGWMEDRIRERFGDGKALGIDVRYLVQKERKGTAHAIGVAADVMDGDFVCVNGDIIVTAEAVKRLIEAQKGRRGNLMTLTEVPNPREFGVVTIGPGDVVQSIEEKPGRPAARTINAGNLPFHPGDIQGHRRHAPVAARRVRDNRHPPALAAEKKVFGIVSKAPWVDVGRPWDLLRANELLLKDLRMEIRGEVEPYATIKGQVRIGEGTVVRKRLLHPGPVSIGRRCDIGPNCYIRPSTTVGDDLQGRGRRRAQKLHSHGPQPCPAPQLRRRQRHRPKVQPRAGTIVAKP